MPNLNDLFPSRYLKAHELKGTSPTVTIARVALETMGRARERKPVAYFVGKHKGLLLNKTNAEALAKIAGSPMTEQWQGVKVRLVPTTDKFGSDVYPVIRIHPAVAA